MFVQAIDVPALVMPSCESGATSPSSPNTEKTKTKGVEWRCLSRKILTQVWKVFVKDEPDVNNLIHKPWRSWTGLAVGLRMKEMKMEARLEHELAASLWIYTKAVIWNGQEHMDVFRNQLMYSVMEAVNWVCTMSAKMRV